MKKMAMSQEMLDRVVNALVFNKGETAKTEKESELVDGVKINRLYITTNSGADFCLQYIKAAVDTYRMNKWGAVKVVGEGEYSVWLSRWDASEDDWCDVDMKVLMYGEKKYADLHEDMNCI